MLVESGVAVCSNTPLFWVKPAGFEAAFTHDVPPVTPPLLVVAAVQP